MKRIRNNSNNNKTNFVNKTTQITDGEVKLSLSVTPFKERLQKYKFYYFSKTLFVIYAASCAILDVFSLLFCLFEYTHWSP